MPGRRVIIAVICVATLLTLVRTKKVPEAALIVAAGVLGLALRHWTRYSICMFRRAISALSLLALLATPVVARTRMLCRYTGLEISGCDEQSVPEQAALQNDGCCDRQFTPALASARTAQQQEIAPPSLHALPQQMPHATPPPRLAVQARHAVPIGPPLILVTRALLI